MSFAGTVKSVTAAKVFKKSLTHAEWARQKELDIENRQYENRRKKAQAGKIAKKKKKKAEEIFAKWSLRKERYDKAKELLLAQTPARCSEDDDWRAIGVAAAAADCMLGIFNIDPTSDAPSKDAFNKENSGKKGKELRVERKLESLGKYFFQYSKGRKGDARHRFLDVTVNEEDAKDMSPQYQENMEDYATAMRMEDKYVLSALQYTPPLGRPPRNEAEALSEATTKILNAMWVKRMKLAWKNCQQQVIRDYTTKLDDARVKDGDRVQKAREKAERERSREGGGGKSQDADEEQVVQPLTKEELKDKVLYNMSIVKLKFWIRKDKEAEEEAAEREKADKRGEGRRTHEQWSKKKDRCRIKLPKQKTGRGGKPIIRSQAPRMDFSISGIVRPEKREISSTTAQLMMNSGLKYAHAINHGSGRREGDLERSRKALLERGHVLKANFKDIHDGRIEGYEEAKSGGRGTKFAKELKQAKDARNDAKHFEQWSRQKSRYDKAIRYLEAIDRPLADTMGSRDSKRAQEENWLSIGKLLKGIDVNLLPQWAAWSKEFKRFGDCQQEWRRFPPVQGEIKGMDVLLKIIKSRRDFDWEAAFTEAVEAKARKRKEDDLSDAEKDKRTKNLMLNKKEVRKFFLKNGCSLTLPEVTQMFNAFDANEDGMLSAVEFTSFAKRARVTSLNPTGPFWAELAQRKDRENRDRGRGGYDDQDREASGAYEWTDAKKNSCLNKLKQKAQVNLEALNEARLLETGKPPMAPRLWLDRDAERDGTDELTLRWSSSKKNGPVPIFYNLETYSDEQSEFVSVYKDPENAGTSGSFNAPRGLFTLKNLSPNTKYSFKLTAFNGFGPSVPTYKSFTTLPKAPPRPIVVNMAVTVDKAEVTLNWGEVRTMNAALKEIHDLFVQCDEDGNGTISAREFDDAVKLPRIKAFMEWCCGETLDFADFDINGDKTIDFTEFCKRLTKKRKGNTHKYLSVFGERGSTLCSVEGKTSDNGSAVESGTKFELLKCADDKGHIGEIKWDTVTAATHDTSWTVTGLTPGQSYQFMVCALNQDGERGLGSDPVIVNTLMTAPLPPKVTNQKTVNGILRLSYPIKISWEEAPELDMSSMLAEGAKTSSSRSERNAKSSPGDALRASDPGAVRHAAHEMRKNPLRASATMSSGKGSGGNSWFKSISTWISGDNKSEYGTQGVGENSLRRVFKKYDRNEDGTLDFDELKHFLKDMGMPCNERAVEACKEAMDKDGNNRVDFNEFHAWWIQHSIAYVLLIDGGVSDQALAQMGGQLPRGKPRYQEFARIYGSDADKDVTSIEIQRGKLKPNTMYRFALRIMSRRGYTPISKPLTLMTPPGTPSQPALIEARSREATLKWWPGPGGAAFKYVLFTRNLSKRSSSSSGWKKCYEGSSNLARITNGLDPDCSYQFKVAAVNRQFVQGDGSIILSVHTGREIDEKKRVITKENYEDFFTIDAQGDIVTGDTILFSERVFKARNSKDASKDSTTGKSSRSTTRPPSKAWEGGGSATLSQSVSSAKPKQVFVTERTVAAVVYKDGQHASRTGSEVSRVLSLQVLWSVVSRNTPEAKSCLIRTGAVTTRKEKDLFEFEVLRTRWQEEDARWSRMEELSIAQMDSGS